MVSVRERVVGEAQQRGVGRQVHLHPGRSLRVLAVVCAEVGLWVAAEHVAGPPLQHP